MAKTIWKFAIEPSPLFSIEMPAGAEVLTLQTQYNRPVIWAIVNPSIALEKRNFCIMGTGMDFDVALEQLEYIGTYQIFEGYSVWHLFEVITDGS